MLIKVNKVIIPVYFESVIDQNKHWQVGKNAQENTGYVVIKIRLVPHSPTDLVLLGREADHFGFTTLHNQRITWNYLEKV